MSARASHRLLPDGKRLHLQHGPIDIVAEAEGAAGEVIAAYRQAVARFETVLTELVAELPILRSPVVTGECPLSGAVAQAMWSATKPYVTTLSTPHFVTPMAAVAGAVADAVLASMVAGRELDRAYVNNGGDIALFLPADAKPFRLGVMVDPEQPASPGAVTITPQSRTRGVATSGWKGRSFSLGIADSVTAFAANAAEADVAATIIANAVNLPGNLAIVRQPAVMLAPDSDLGEQPVTVAVGRLSDAEIDFALAAGEAKALALVQAGLINGALLVLRNIVRVVGDMPSGEAAVSDQRAKPAIEGTDFASRVDGNRWKTGAGRLVA